MACYFFKINFANYKAESLFKELKLLKKKLKLNFVGFDTSCPISEFVPKSSVTDVNNLNLQLTVNGVTKQNGL